MNKSVHLGPAVRKRRERLGLSQEDLASRSGLDRTYVSGIERGVRNPTLKILIRLATALELNLSELVSLAEGAAFSRAER